MHVAMPVFDEHRERRFQLEHVRYSLPIVRLTIPAAVFLYFTFFIWDYFQPGFDPMITFGVRFGFGVFAALTFVLTFTSFWVRHAQMIMCVYHLVVTLGVALVLAVLPNGFVNGYGGVCLAMMYACGPFYLHFRTAVIYCSAVLIGTNALMILSPFVDAQPFIWVNTNFFLVSFSIVGCVFTYLVEHNLRTQFGKYGTIAASWIAAIGDVPTDARAHDRKKVFICYRRDQASDVVGRLIDRLLTFPALVSILRDIDIVPLGTDFRTFLGQVIRTCDAMIVVIGPGWVDRLSDRPKADVSDPVVAEIELALNLGLRVIPVITEGAVMPSPRELPASIREFSYLNAARLRRDPDFDPDVSRLLDELLRPTERSADHSG